MGRLIDKIIGKSITETKSLALDFLKEQSPNHFSSYAKDYGFLYQLLVASKELSETELDNAIETSIVKQGKNDYKFLKENGKGKVYIFPTDLQMPECLAYNVHNNIIPKENLIGLRFDCEIDEFLKKYGHSNLPQRLRHRLLSNSKNNNYYKNY